MAAENSSDNLVLVLALEAGLAHRLDAFCAATDEEAGKVVADAIALHLDALEAPTMRERGAADVGQMRAP